MPEEVITLSALPKAEVAEGVPEQRCFRFEADVSSLTSWGVLGWAWAPDNPDEPVRVEAVLGDRVIAHTVANQKRSDVALKGRPGHCGFTLRFDEEVTGPTRPLIRLRLGEQVEILADCPWAVIEGHVDVITVWGVTGWAWMPTEPETTLSVDVWVNERIVGHARAGQDRPDIRASGRQSGRYGFVFAFETPPCRDDRIVCRVATPDGAYVQLPNVEFSEVVGFVDVVTDRRVVGWTWRPERPEVSLIVEAVLDGAIVGRTNADRYLEHLATSGRGSGKYGFVLDFDPPLTGTKAPCIQARYEDRSFVLLDAGELITSPSHAAPPMQPVEPAQPVVEGAVDYITRHGARGWARLPNLPDTSVTVEAMQDGCIVGTAVADQFREDLAYWGKGTGRHGFAVTFEHELLGSAPTIGIRIDGDFHPLTNASSFHDAGEPAPAAQDHGGERGQAFKDADIDQPPSPEGSVDYLTRTGASGWAWLRGTPDTAVTVKAILNGKEIGSAVTGDFREDLVYWGKGTGYYGFTLTFEAPVAGSEAPSFQVAGPHKSVTLPAPPLPAEASSNTTPVVAGNVDRLTRWDVSGWAWMPSDPMRALEVRAILGGKIIGRAIADELRQDLLDHGLGTGRYGYLIVFDTPVAGDSIPVIQPCLPLSEPLPGATTLPPASRQELAQRPRGSIETLLIEHQKFTAPGPDFEDFDPAILGDRNSGAEDDPQLWLIAFYLPQFHAIKENDAFWGEGFTEWRQLPRGISRYPGHYQPRTPRDLGFYNLLAAETLEKQFALAKAAGVTAFAYYYYWFNGTRVLEKPLDALLASDVDLPFMIIWANENWTRTWDGSDSSVLLRQDYRKADDETLVADLARHFNDPRYLRIGGRPLFVIYNPSNIPDAAKVIRRWRRLLRTRQNVDPLIFMSQAFGARDPEPFGLDGAIEFPPHKLADELPGRKTPDAYSPSFTGRVIGYEDFTLASLTEEEPSYPLVKTAVPSWDNESRRPNRGLSLEGISPAQYEKWLRALCVKATRKPIYGQPIVAINAWNEWAEGAYLEPDVYYGAAYLNATARARKTACELLANHGARPRVSVIFPNFNHEKFIVERIQSVLDQTVPPDEIIFLDDGSKDGSVDLARKTLDKSSIPYRIVLNEQNSGGVFRQWVKGMALATHDLIWVAETDDSAHPDFLLHVLPQFQQEDIRAVYGRIQYISPEGVHLPDLDGYYDDLRDFDWDRSVVLPAYRAFSWDFTVKNVIPNASGLVFRKPILTEPEISRLYEYRFAGDWYFYALVVRGGRLAYCRPAVSYFRLNTSSASRTAFFTDQHLAEHAMVIADLWHLYAVGRSAVAEHAGELARHLEGCSVSDVEQTLFAAIARDERPHPLRICIGSHSFDVGGGEVMPLELANELRRIGHHVTYLVVERPNTGKATLRHRLRADIPVVYWDDVQSDFDAFVHDYGFEVINSHNVSLDYRLALRQRDVPVSYVSSLHGGFETVPDIFTEEVFAGLRRIVTSWLYLSEKNLTLLRKNRFPAATFHRSYNAIPAFTGEWVDRQAFRDEHSIPQDAFVLVQCSRAIEEKGWSVAAEVVATVAKKTTRDVRLVLIGEGPAAEKFRSATPATTRQVILLGQVDTPIRYFRCCDAAIFPSTYSGETSPLFILEAFAAGLPVLSTDIGEINDIMGQDHSERPGATVAHDQGRQAIVASMVRELSRIVTNKKTFQRMRKNALKTSARFSLSDLANFYVDAFQRAIKSRASAGPSHLEMIRDV